jgi:Uma2 family endonuclease
LVFEVISSSDRWSDVQLKVAEYLNVGVTAVCVVDDATRSVHVFRLDQPLQISKAADEFSLPEILSDFRVEVRRIFE